MTKKWFLLRLMLIPAIGSILVCFIILPAIGVIRNVVLYNWFSLDNYLPEIPFILVYGFIPVYLILLPFTALGLYLYAKLTKRSDSNTGIHK